MNTSKPIVDVIYKGTPLSMKDTIIKEVMNGTLTSFNSKNIGVNSIDIPHAFYNFTNLQSADFSNISIIPSYTCYNCYNLKNLTLSPNTTSIGEQAFYSCNNSSLSIDLNMNGAVGQYAFYNVKIRQIKGIYSNIGYDAFYWGNSSGSILNNIDIKVNGTISDYAFAYYHRTLSNFKLDPASNITSLGSYAFAGLGCNRINASTNRFTFDFRNSSFTSPGSYLFSGDSSYGYKNKYCDVYFPNTLTTINNYTFYYTDNFNIYYNSVPSLSNTNVFNSATNFRNFFPYNLLRQAKLATNWSSSTNNIVNSIYGYAQENTFIQGQTLPQTDSRGYQLTWYDDVALTNQVSIVDDPNKIYYCIVGARIAVPLTITEANADVIVSDGVNIYTSGDSVPYNTTITITATNHAGYPYLKTFTLNGTTITSGDTYLVQSSDNEIIIVCRYFDTLADPIYGVSWVNDTSTTMTRTDDAVGLSYSINTSTGAITSDFNDTFPWNETTFVEDSAGNKFLRFPDMYFRVGTDSNGDINSVAVSRTAASVGDWYLCKSFDYGIYGGSLNITKLESKSGQTRLNYVTRSSLRTYADNSTEIGYIYHQLDLKHKIVTMFLWWIEWANKNSKSIMTGHIQGSPSQNGAKLSTGGTDTLTTPSGYNTSTWQMRYHYIEDFIGNLMEFLDGCLWHTNTLYATDNPAYFNDTATNMSVVNITKIHYDSGSCAIAIGWDSAEPFLLWSSKTSGNEPFTTGFCNSWENYTGDTADPWSVILSGAHYSGRWTGDGLCAVYKGGSNSTASFNNTGGRLLRQPTSNFSS